MNKKIIIGYGTGRCGTKSLASFLNQQEGFNVTHEKVALGWYQAFTDTEIAVRDFVSRDSQVIGDVGFYWINYLDLILRKYPNAKAINIFRDEEEVVESFWSYKKPDEVNQVFEKWCSYPYDSSESTKDAIAFTIKRYRFLENEVLKHYPASIYRLRMGDLNNKNKLEDLLDWVGSSKLRMLKPVHINTREQILSKNASERKRLFGLTFLKRRL